jgi:hypothetical protein
VLRPQKEAFGPDDFVVGRHECGVSGCWALC